MINIWQVLRRPREFALVGIVCLMTMSGPAFADFSLTYKTGAFTFGDQAHVGDSVVGALTFIGVPNLTKLTVRAVL